VSRADLLRLRRQGQTRAVPARRTEDGKLVNQQNSGRVAWLAVTGWTADRSWALSNSELIDNYQ
jgi:hypothetical protein